METVAFQIKHWSFSRASRLEQCPRQYLLHDVVPGAPEGLVPETVQQNARFLRQVTNLPMLVGRAVHQAAHRWLKSYLEGRPIGWKTLLEESWDYIQHCVTFSQKELYFYRGEDALYYTILQEHIYRIELTEGYLRRLYRKLRTALNRLTAWPVLPSRSELGGVRLLQSEQLSSVQHNGVNLWFKLDALFQLSADTLLVVDWKLSEYDRQRDLLQLALYGTYVAEQYRPVAGQILLSNYYLSTGRRVQQRFCPELASKVNRYVDHSLRRMGEVEAAFFSGNGLASQPPVWKDGPCRRCPFRKICFPRGRPT